VGQVQADAPDVFARKAFAGVAVNKAIIIAPWWWRFFWWLDRLSPSPSLSFAQRNFQNRFMGIDELRAAVSPL